MKKLQSVGFSEQQAEVFAAEQFRLLDEQLAYKHALAETESNLRRDIKTAELELHARLAETKAELIRWVVGVGMLQFTLIAALLLRLLPTV